MYAIGTQESGKSIKTSVVMPSKAKWVKKLQEHMGNEYTDVADETLAAMHLILFVRTDLLRQVSQLNTAHVATGFGDMIGNKGGVGICCDIGKTSFLFLNGHFQAFQNNIKGRNLDYEKITTKMALRSKANNAAPNVVDRFDRVFFLGDLNYRVNANRSCMNALLDRNFHDVMVANDQLQIEMRNQTVFQGFLEAPITFAPTYKFDVGTDVYDTSKKARVPSWTDRVLWKSSEKIDLKTYDSVRDLKISDHRAVYALFGVAYEAWHTGEGPEVKGESSSKACVVM